MPHLLCSWLFWGSFQCKSQSCVYCRLKKPLFYSKCCSNWLFLQSILYHTCTFWRGGCSGIFCWGLMVQLISLHLFQRLLKKMDFFFLLLVQLSKWALMKEIVHILAHLRGSMWEVCLEVQKTADLGLFAIPAVNVCVCVWRSVHTHLSTDTTFRGISPVY